MADSQLILDLLLLHMRGGCSLAVLLFFLILVGHVVIICLLVSAQCVLSTELHIGTKIHKQHNFFEW